MAVVEVLTAKLEADTRNFTGRMNDAAATSDKMQRFTTRLERSFRGLAFAAGGVPGPLGNVAFALTQVFTKTGPLLAITGIFAGIAVGIQRAQKQAEEFEAALARIHAREERERKAIQAAGALGTPTTTPLQQLERLREALRVEQEGLAAMAGAVPRQLGGAPTDLERATLQRIKDLQAAINELAKNEAKWRREITESAFETWRADQRRFAALKEVDVALQRMKEREATLAKSRTGFAEGMDKELQGLDKALLGIAEKGRHSTLMEDLRRLGESAGKQFAIALITGIESMQDLMRSVLIQFLSIGLDEFFGQIFSSVVGGGGSNKAVSGEGPGRLVGPASFALQMPNALAAPTTPFAIARDAQWQSLLRSSLIVARTDGFR